MVLSINLDISNNKTLFNKDVPDGVFCITTGMFANYSDPLCLTGGNCSILVKFLLTKGI
jgi:hypothetical protein